MRPLPDRGGGVPICVPLLPKKSQATGDVLGGDR
jgi:hypothetical protein